MRHTIAAIILALSLGCTAQGQDTTAPAPLPNEASRPPAPTSPKTAQPQETAMLPMSIPGTSGTLVRFELAERIVDREPAGIATTFSRAAAPRVFAFLEIQNKHGAPFELDVRFERIESTTPGRGIKLSIPAAERWRTQALTATRKSGRYRAVVTTSEGTVVTAREFDVVD
jgi:hypothetical protein